MTDLMNSLQTDIPGEIAVIDTKSSTEENVCDKNQVTIAKSRRWKVFDHDTENEIDYEGSEVEE